VRQPWHLDHLTEERHGVNDLGVEVPLGNYKDFITDSPARSTALKAAASPLLTVFDLPCTTVDEAIDGLNKVNAKSMVYLNGYVQELKDKISNYN